MKDISYLTTLAGYVHWKLTGRKVLGVGEASGMFPIDSDTCNYDAGMVAKYNDRIAPRALAGSWRTSCPRCSLRDRTPAA